MASAPPLTQSIRTVEIDVLLSPGTRPVRMRVPASTREEAYALLNSIGNGTVGGVAYGSVLEPLRNGYKRNLEGVERQILQRRQALGTGATPAQLETLARWGSAERTRTARIWRIPTPVTGLGLELRDWRVYGWGGRTYDNLLTRNARAGRTGVAANNYIIGSATRSNPGFNASVARGARILRGGGGVLAVAGLGVTAHDIWRAPANQRGAVAQRHAVGIAGGIIGAEVAAGLVMVGAGLLVATPPGWIIIAVGLVGGIAGSMIADHYFYPDNHQTAASTLASGRVLQCTANNPLGAPRTARAR
ncbi:hypothetical protein [Sphingomonas radiodurans]|uniref:hypothetical protein n=1 Tax=Sphingomonas radiodurans TaxID=2890321 RepID=UPI001E471FBF|nr:hypothetical protein [Sphingomonas radiodurans]WBH16008.1 hypothetical protein LLW23_14530 [Sphingomonas radiodurans]